MGVALENVRLFDETKETLERQTATAEILKVISESPTDVQPTFDAIVHSAQRLFARPIGLDRSCLERDVLQTAGRRNTRRIEAGRRTGSRHGLWTATAPPAPACSSRGLIVVPDCEAAIPTFPRMRDLALNEGLRDPACGCRCCAKARRWAACSILRAEAGEFADKEDRAGCRPSPTRR